MFVRDDDDHVKGSVFQSDAHGKAFSLTLRNAVRSDYGLVDFIEVESLEGVIIANQRQEGPKEEMAKEENVHGGLVQNKG